MKTYEPPRVTFIGADPKILALRRAIDRAGRQDTVVTVSARFIGLWQARNRRTRVLIARVKDAYDYAR
jgi:hypothetical protein